MVKTSDKTNKQERDRNPPYKQDHVLLFIVYKNNWPIRKDYLSHMTIIMQILFTSQDHQLTKISPILQAWFLYSVNIYKYDI